MAKKILFIISNLGEGGVSKSIVNLLNLLDRKRFDISLLICGDGANLLEPLLPDGITVIRHRRIARLFAGPSGLVPLLKEGAFAAFVGSCARLLLSRFDKAKAGTLLARLMPAIEGEFDVIVDYNGQQQLYYMIDKLKARKKYTFFHSDYAKWPYYYKADKRYFPKADGIFTISEICAASLRAFFPDEAHKIQVIPNLSSPELIHKLAREEAPEMNVDTLRLITVGHISKNKGSDLALRAAKIMKDKGMNFHWFFIGKDSGDMDYKSMIKELGLDENITFLGLRRNPYAYTSRADIFVHPSLFEGRSIALDEAKILAKPVVVTNFSTVNDQFTDGVNASIVEMTPEAIAEGIRTLAEDTDLQRSYIERLKSETPDNDAQLANIYRILDA